MDLPVALLIPVYNDWASLRQLIQHLDDMASALVQPVVIYIVDDGSIQPLDTLQLPGLSALTAIHCITLVRNLGHQRAIAVGLAQLAQQEDIVCVVVMDADGEDVPTDIPKLFALHQQTPQNIIVAQRTRRSEGFLFRIFYAIYQRLFRMLTSQEIDFGNFCLIPATRLRHLTYDSNLWNHLAATIRRSRLPITKLKTARGIRYAGRSSMNFLSLVLHGLSAISVYLDMILVRMLILAFGGMLLAALGVGLAVYIRLFTTLAIPGWATNVVGLLVIIIFQILIFSSALTIVILNRRSYLLLTPATDGLQYVHKLETLYTARSEKNAVSAG